MRHLAGYARVEQSLSCCFAPWYTYGMDNPYQRYKEFHMAEQTSNKISRRDSIKVAAGMGAAAVAALYGGARAEDAAGSTNPDDVARIALPYAQDSLAPYISAETVGFHWGRHHLRYEKIVQGYISKNEQYQSKTLIQLLTQTSGGILTDSSVYTAAALLHNHNLYWTSLKPGGGVTPGKGKLFDAVKLGFGSFDSLKKRIKDASKGGPGWVWIAAKGSDVIVTTSGYQSSIVPDQLRPLICIDLWEHAYYLDYRDKADKYVDAVLEHLVDWNRAEARLVA